MKIISSCGLKVHRFRHICRYANEVSRFLFPVSDSTTSLATTSWPLYHKTEKQDFMCNILLWKMFIKSPKNPNTGVPQKWFSFRKSDERGWKSTLSTLRSFCHLSWICNFFYELQFLWTQFIKSNSGVLDVYWAYLASIHQMKCKGPNTCAVHHDKDDFKAIWWPEDPRGE